MLRLKADPTFKAPVSITAPGGVRHTVVFHFIHRTVDEFKAFIEGDEWKGRKDAENIMAIARGWEGTDGEWSLQSLDLMLQNYHGAAGVIVDTYIRELTQGTALAKN